MDDLRSEIRNAVVAQCGPYQFDKHWGFLPAHDEVRCLPADPTTLIATLSETYSEDALIDAGVAEFDENGSLRTRAKLNAPEKLVVILRDRQTHAVVDMLTEMGSVFEDDRIGNRMVLVAWSPATLDHQPRPGFDVVTTHFRELESEDLGF